MTIFLTLVLLGIGLWVTLRVLAARKKKAERVAYEMDSATALVGAPEPLVRAMAVGAQQLTQDLVAGLSATIRAPQTSATHRAMAAQVLSLHWAVTGQHAYVEQMLGSVLPHMVPDGPVARRTIAECCGTYAMSVTELGGAQRSAEALSLARRGIELDRHALICYVAKVDALSATAKAMAAVGQNPKTQILEVYQTASWVKAHASELSCGPVDMDSWTRHETWALQALAQL